jgi:exopolysaccharide biosynthesis polyprenyl glycosylphosphotransferase
MADAVTSPPRTVDPRLLAEPADVRSRADLPIAGDESVTVAPLPPLLHASASAGRPWASGHLRALLVAIDVTGAALAWGAVVMVLHPSETASDVPVEARLAVALALVGVTVALVARERLYLSRVCQVRAHEIGGLLRVGVLAGVAALLLGETLGVALHTGTAIAGGVCVVVVLALLRGGYRAWLRACRARGQCTRDVVVLGTNDEALELVHLFTDQPEIGYRVEGVIGDEKEWTARGTPVPWLGGTEHAALVVARRGAGAVVVASAIAGEDLNRLVHDLVDEDVHVFVSTGIHNVGHARLRPVPLCHEPFFYVEGHSPSTLRAAEKRVFDVVLGGILLVLALPVLACAALAIKLGDGGPVFFRQQRVGLGGRYFEILKLRTMVPRASEQLAVLEVRNERTDGPLFKATNDPRITRVGRFLRASSIDELPQLVNVLRGEMSLVGPRPALPAEVAAFDSELLARLDVRPGITGLWQIEGRDNPSFHVYRRLDLNYVENWSISLDAVILWRTALSTLKGVLKAITAPLARRLTRRRGAMQTKRTSSAG